MLDELGIPQEFRAGFNEEEAFGVYRQNWQTLKLFVKAATQWRVGMAGPVGLDYVAVKVVAEALGIALTASRMEGLMVMESEVLKMMAEKRGR